MIHRLQCSCDENHAAFGKMLIEEGLFLWRRLIPDALIDAHLAEYQSRNETSSSVVPTSANRNDWYFAHAATAQLIFNAQLLSFLRCWFGDEPIVDRPSTGMYSRGARSHRDSDNVVSDPRGGRLRLWIALEDVHSYAGPVYWVPQSHRLITPYLEDAVLKDHPELRGVIEKQTGTTTARAFREATRTWPQYEFEIIEAQISELRLPRVIPSMKKGDAVLFDADVVHGSVPIVDKSLTRKHMLVFWCSSTASLYDNRVWWQPNHEYRRQENAVPVQTLRTPFGLRYTWDARDTIDLLRPPLVMNVPAGDVACRT